MDSHSGGSTGKNQVTGIGAGRGSVIQCVGATVGVAKGETAAWKKC
jgi:hypothetical protein